MEKVKEKAPYVGMIIGLLAIILGILVLTDCFSMYCGTGDGGIYRNDKGYAMFGSDYYTYSNNNMAYAAEGAVAAASQVKFLTELVTTVAGLGMMVFGAFTACLFATKIPCCSKKETKVDDQSAVETPVEPIVE